MSKSVKALCVLLLASALAVTANADLFNVSGSEGVEGSVGDAITALVYDIKETNINNIGIPPWVGFLDGFGTSLGGDLKASAEVQSDFGGDLNTGFNVKATSLAEVYADPFAWADAESFFDVAFEVDIDTYLTVNATFNGNADVSDAGMGLSPSGSFGARFGLFENLNDPTGVSFDYSGSPGTHHYNASVLLHAGTVYRMELESFCHASGNWMPIPLTHGVFEGYSSDVDLDASFVPVPMPSALLLGGLGLAAASGFLKRRRRK